MSVAQTNALSAARTAARPAAMPCSGPSPGAGSRAITTPGGSGGSSHVPPPSAPTTTTTGPVTVRMSSAAVRYSNVEPCHSREDFGVPIRDDRPPASTTPAASTRPATA